MQLIVMGVSGCGKSSIGQALAQYLGCDFVEGDSLHSAANIARMRSGQPLRDADREPWLRAIRHVLDDHRAAGRGTVVACSALKRSYRELLRHGEADTVFIYLEVDRAELERRLARRQGHFMPASLLASQLATLETPADDAAAVTIDANGSIDATLTNVLAAVPRLQVTS